MLETIAPKTQRAGIPPGDPILFPSCTPEELTQSHARKLAAELAWIPSIHKSNTLGKRASTLEADICRLQLNNHLANEFRKDSPLLESSLHAVREVFRSLQRLPHVKQPDGAVVPRILAIANGFNKVSDGQWDERLFLLYLETFQQTAVLNLVELRTLNVVLTLLWLEQVRDNFRLPEGNKQDVSVYLENLRKLNHLHWLEFIEPLIVFDRYLQRDPAGAYPQMQPESRDVYRNEVAYIAQYSDLSEVEVAQMALQLSEDAKREHHPDPNAFLRLTHVGYYLVSDGACILWRKAHGRLPFARRTELFVKHHADDLYIPGIVFITAVLGATLAPMLGLAHTGLLTAIVISVVLLLPCSEAAVQLTNYLFTSILRPSILPKLDFRRGIPESCVTMVAVPALLLNRAQVEKLVDDLEIRFLGNADKNLHFALLTDLRDSLETPREKEEAALAGYCAELVGKLNQKYRHQHLGSFFLFHRKLLYNPREQAWMGWERKRGKLLDFNRYLRGGPAPYDLIAGDLSIIPTVRFVISLDADTLLPRETAKRMVGTLAHPLNRGIVDRQLNIVVAGYGILQPRVAISVQSMARSRFARIYSGETGLDIYSHAVSDVYQDLYGEGSYVGKGIYDVDIVHQVLENRFPNNLLLSHDLIEGAYARAGLVSDIEIVEDYPSHYSAYNRRRHRWLRGDWQIVEWLFSRVPDNKGSRVRNPISLISQWKILDNLRRGLVEPATFFLIVVGWLILPVSPFVSTGIAVALLLLPQWTRLAVQLSCAVLRRSASQTRAVLDDFISANVNVAITLAFLAHQMLVAMDAMIRALIRRFFTGKRMLQWVTSEEEELALGQRTPLEVYLDWTPALACAIAFAILLVRPNALFAALPVLGLWTVSKFLSVWLNQPPREPSKRDNARQRLLLRRIALYTWRYFEELSTLTNHWLIPDNVLETPAITDERISPTNLGLLLDSRLAAHQFGYLTLPEFVDLTSKTLSTVSRLPRFRGHLYNWYSNTTLQPLTPLVVSSVDSGNLVASLWTLEQGCLAKLREPLIDFDQANGITDYLQELMDLPRMAKAPIKNFINHWQRDWLDAIEDFSFDVLKKKRRARSKDPGPSWIEKQLESRIKNVRSVLHLYTPWLLPEFRSLEASLPGLDWGKWHDIPLEKLPLFIDTLQMEIALVSELRESTGFSDQTRRLCEQLASSLPSARVRIMALISDLRAIAEEAGDLAERTDFAFMLHPQRKQLAVSFDVATQTLSEACYDQLASESRIAAFVAIAKNDIPQDPWFALGRAHRSLNGRIVLLSWAGTMFEYLMPCLWMRTYGNTLLDRACIEAVDAQREYAERKRIPWGISESSYSERDAEGIYKYFAFGQPDLALRDTAEQSLVISPYSTLLALHVSPKQALENLHRMDQAQWFGAFGLYEAADYTNTVTKKKMRHPEIVWSWMAHHQGMSLLALANFLYDGVVRNWFHKNPSVQATELLLQERPVTRRNLPSPLRRIAA